MKIDLSCATEEWLKARYTRDGVFNDRRYEDYLRWKLGSATDALRATRFERLLQETYLGDLLLDGISVDRSYIEPRHGSITLFFGGSLGSDDLKRVIEGQIVLDGTVYSFDRLELEASTDSDIHCGETSESPVAQFRLVYKGGDRV